MDPTKLRLFNSLSRKKDGFGDPSTRTLTWYNCGPTVYDQSHMGHARSYISLDIIRRILKDYFRYDILYCMNITDIDDKIIKKARQEYLINKYAENLDEKQLQVDIEKAAEYWQCKLNGETDTGKIQMINRILASKNASYNTVQERFNNCNDLLCDYLDSQQGSTITDNSIFADLPRRFERQFFQEMDALNVLKPDIITRVSEYIPQIISFIEQIITNGFGYESSGSVYFDTVKFGSDSKHKYGKLLPEAIGDLNALNEGEGVLSVDNTILQAKKNPADFALWKSSKLGEPSWDSPWGKGRPGWHIECSAMACDVLGHNLDIHSGGVDLKFPHHENEIAQTEAYCNTGSNWVQHFLHTGHLTISGCKMSKSLKNFISIKEALQRHTASQLRIAFLLHTWHDVLDYSDNTVHDAIVYEKFVQEFYLSIKDILRSTATSKDVDAENQLLWSTKDSDLHEGLHKTKIEVDNALCDNLDTRKAMMSVKELISSCNIYLKDNIAPNCSLLKKCATYISWLFEIFGLDLLFNRKSDATGGDVIDREETVLPYVQLLADFREKVRLIAKDAKQMELLELCDRLRDSDLPELGVRLEDKEVCGVFKTTIKLVDKEVLLREKEEKRKLEEAKREEKERKKREQEKLAEAKEAQRRMPPSQLFIGETDKYSKFDEKGIPTHDASGEPITKSQIKKLQKLYEQQEKKYNAYLAETTKS